MELLQLKKWKLKTTHAMQNLELELYLAFEIFY